MSPRYFRSDGDHIKVTKLRPFEASTFADFASEITRSAHMFKVDRTKFLAAKKEEQKSIKEACPYVVPYVPTKELMRGGAYVTTCNLAIADVDEAAAARAVLKQLETAGDAWLPWSFIVYHTAKSTPENPRLRIIVSAQGIPKASYAKAIALIVQLIGVSVDKASYEPSRAMFYPVLFKGETLEQNGPVVHCSTTGGDLSVEVLASAPAENSTSAPTEASNWDLNADITNLRPPLDGIDLAEAGRVLQHIDASCVRAVWRQVCMALKHQFPDDAEGAYELFDEWSSKAASKYKGRTDTREAWDGVQTNPLDRAPITFASVLRLAYVEGYKKSASAKPVDLPPIVAAKDIFAAPAPRPDELIKGVLFRRRKMIIAAPSKARKTWANLDLAVSVATGMKWLGYETQKAAVLYLDFELGDYEFAQRLGEVVSAKFAENDLPLFRWALRGRTLNLAHLLPEMRRFAKEKEVGLIVVDPLYAALEGRDENNNSEMSSLMLELETLAQETGAAISIVHHFAKGSAASKEAQDRMSGAGALARAADAMLVLTPHENDTDEAPLLIADFITRSFKKPAKTVLRWVQPLWQPDGTENPEAVKQAGGRKRLHSEDQLADLVGTDVVTYKELQSRARDAGIRGGSFTNLLPRATKEGFIVKMGDRYARCINALDLL